MWSDDKRPEHAIDVGAALKNMKRDAVLNSSRATKDKSTRLTMKLTRKNGTFGMALSDQNRVTSLPDGPAKKAGLKQFDLVTHIDGVEIVGKISEYVKPKQQAIMLTIARPPQSMATFLALPCVISAIAI